jgi:hypothetical protein
MGERPLARELAPLVGVVAFIGCGGNDGDVEVSRDERPYVDAIVQYASGDSDNKFQLNEDQAECVAPVWVDVIGVDRLRRAGLAPDQLPTHDLAPLATLGLSDDEGEAMYAAFDDCDIDVRDSFYESVAELGGVPEGDDEACVTDAVSDDLLMRTVVVGFTTGPEGIATDDAVQRGIRDVRAACPDVPPSAVIVLATPHDRPTATLPTITE